MATESKNQKIKVEVDFINSLNASDEVKEKIFHKNAEKYILC